MYKWTVPVVGILILLICLLLVRTIDIQQKKFENTLLDAGYTQGRIQYSVGAQRTSVDCYISISDISRIANQDVGSIKVIERVTKDALILPIHTIYSVKYKQHPTIH